MLGYCRVLPGCRGAAGCCRVPALTSSQLVSAAGVLPGAAGCCRVLPGSCRVLPGCRVAGYCRVAGVLPGRCRVRLPGCQGRGSKRDSLYICAAAASDAHATEACRLRLRASISARVKGFRAVGGLSLPPRPTHASMVLEEAPIRSSSKRAQARAARALCKQRGGGPAGEHTFAR
jgi:hypothetical protein